MPSLPRKILRYIALLTAIVASATAFEKIVPVAEDAQWPERASVVLAAIGKDRFPIAAFAKQTPVVVQNDKLVPLPNAKIALRPATDFAPGLVRFDHAKVTMPGAFALSTGKGKRQTVEFATDSDTKQTTFKAEVTADHDLRHVFVVLAIFVDWGTQILPRVELFGSELPDLSAGKRQAINLTFPAPKSQFLGEWAVLVFSEGNEVRSSLGQQTIARFYDQIDRDAWQKAVTERSKGGPARCAVFRDMPIQLSEKSGRAYAGQNVRVRLSISETGIVERVELDNVNDENLRAELSEQFKWWLFLPSVAESGPVRAKRAGWGHREPDGVMREPDGVMA